MISLVIMAAGLGSRYGGIKQLEAIDRAGHLIIDYSVHDAIEAGFQKIIFVIRRDLEEAFRERIGDRIEAVCRSAGVAVSYVFQELTDIPGVLPEGRTKPWGTGQAVLAAAGEIDGPFAVINSDDYYGKNTYVRISGWLAEEHAPSEICLAGFRLKNTLSENGGVTRGVCRVDENGILLSISETKDILRTEEGIRAAGWSLDEDTIVSMNMWGFRREFLDLLRFGFTEFFERFVPFAPTQMEFLLPLYLGDLVSRKEVSVRVIETNDTWFGVTYQEDHPAVVESFQRLIEEGVYPEDLFSDLI